jgi:hypothetical protein
MRQPIRVLTASGGRAGDDGRTDEELERELGAALFEIVARAPHGADVTIAIHSHDAATRGALLTALRGLINQLAQPQTELKS